MEQKVDNQVAAPAEMRTPNLHRANNRSLRVRMEGWRQWRQLGRRKNLVQRKNKRTHLTPTGLLMEGVCTQNPVVSVNAISQQLRSGRSRAAALGDQRTSRCDTLLPLLRRSRRLRAWTTARRHARTTRPTVIPTLVPWMTILVTNRITTSRKFGDLAAGGVLRELVCLFPQTDFRGLES